MTFFETIHCRSKAHCRRCRSVVYGRTFRSSILVSFPDLKTPDFSCPENLPWDHTKTQKPTPRLDGPQAIQNLLKKIADLPSDSPKIQLLKSLSAQVGALYKEGRGGSCQDKAAYRRRLHQKLLYYIGEYAPPETPLQPPRIPPAPPP
jgi:hypothetical protein